MNWASTEPPGLAPVPATPLDDIRMAFELFDAWEDTYRFIIELGQEVAQMPAALRTPEALVRGCQSQVWLVPRLDAASGHLRFDIDSDAHIVRGLIAVLLAVYDDRSPGDIVAFDIEGLFDELGLLSHLSPTRGNGLRVIVQRIRAVARATAEKTGPVA